MGYRFLDEGDPAAKNIPPDDPLGPIVFDTLKECVDQMADMLARRGQAKTVDMSLWLGCQVHLDPKTHPEEK